MPEPTIAAAAATAGGVAAVATPVITEALKSLAPTIMSRLGQVAKAVGDRAAVALEIGFKDYLITSYNKCRYFKSILSPNTPIEVIGHYVNINLSCDGKVTSDIGLIEDVFEKKRIVVTGLAGSGKSMFMKYITISHFENPRGAVPLFVELRHFNAITDIDLLTHIRISCTSKLHNVTRDQFELSLRAGAFLLILDGFDELNHEVRDSVQKQILSIEKDFPDTAVIVSSRPDDRFSSWTSYFVYKVEALTRAQVVQLVQNLEYDGGVKRRFLKEVSGKLYDSHKSFLSSPLLASIMLLTYEEFAEIPQKMHAFYGQAFDTLFQKHDASKEQYQRKTHTQLSREVFKECFSVFCAFSYLEQKYSFEEDDLIEKAKISLKYMSGMRDDFPKSVTEKQFIDDLFESVCMLQKDGTEIAFVHRSFQEYFSALFVRNLSGEKVRKFLDRCAIRFGDTVISMASDMAREVIENEWVIPTITEIEIIMNIEDCSENFGGKYGSILPGMFMACSRRHVFLSASAIDESKYGSVESIARLYPKHIKPGFFVSKINDVSLGRLEAILKRNEDKSESKSYKDIEKFISNAKDHTGMNGSIHVASQEDWLFEELGVRQSFEKFRSGLAAIRKEIGIRGRRKDNILSEFL